MSVIVILFTLSEATRRELSFAYTNPSLRTAYTAPFVHLTVDHLLGNITVFVLVTGALYALSRRSRTQWLCFSALVVALSVFPLAVSLLNFAVPRGAVTDGFSGVNMTLVGFLTIAVGQYLEARRGRPLHTGLLLAAFFCSTGGVAAIAVPHSPLSVAVGTVSMTLGLMFGAGFIRHERQPRVRQQRWQAAGG